MNGSLNHTYITIVYLSINRQIKVYFIFYGAKSNQVISIFNNLIDLQKHLNSLNFYLLTESKDFLRFQKTFSNFDLTIHQNKRKYGTTS